MASSSSSSSRVRKQYRQPMSEGEEEAMEKMKSPVPYREGPYDYSPAMMCDCRKKAPRWISWSDLNPGRRYYRCPFGMTPNDCGYYVWIDREATKHERTLLKDLRDAVWQLKKDEVQLRQRMQQEELKNAHLRQVFIEVEKERDELNEELQKMKLGMIQIPSDKKEGRKWSIMRWFVVVAILAFFMSKFKK